MKYQVIGPLPIATNKGDVEPGKTVDSADMDERTNFDALVAAGHLEPADDKPAAKKPDEAKK
jgi:hypothetical protein